MHFKFPSILFSTLFFGCLFNSDDSKTTTPPPANIVWEWKLEKNESNQIAAGIVYSECGDQTTDGTVNMRWKVASSGPVDIIITASRADKDSYIAGQAFNHFPTLASYGSLNYNREARIDLKSCRTITNRASSAINFTQEYWIEVLKP